MPRQVRMESGTGIYHVMLRGINHLNRRTKQEQSQTCLNFAFNQMTWWKALLIGCSISITIEALQFWFMKGFSEVDDVMHNTVGCVIGYLIFSGF